MMHSVRETIIVGEKDGNDGKEGGLMERIRKRVRKYKLSRVVEVGEPDVEKPKSFKYIIMNLPVEKISGEKLAEMRKKAGFIRNLLDIRIAREIDIPGLRDLYNAAFFQCPDPYRPITIEDMTKIFHKATIIIANLYGTDAGFIILKIEQRSPDEAQGTEETPVAADSNSLREDDVRTVRVGVIAGIAVLPQHRNKGVATAIGLKGWEYLSDKNLDFLQCEVYEENEPSLSLITWVGFRPVGELVLKAPSAAAINPLERI
ncbi:GNAT family N-acetyltransferase [Candidatus Bathyarchaeota archaeon]|nr:GNAT family N-acetyltransferase [Candidatus Bathyarchaeota archaeon]